MTQAAATSGQGPIVTVEEQGRRREFASADLPVTLGRGARNVRLGGEPVTGTRELHDGDVVAFDRARLECRIAGSTLTLRVDSVVTAGDTPPPDLDELARAGNRAADVAITPIAFKPHTTAASTRADRGVSRTTIGLSAGFALLAITAWFAFTAKSVALDIEPAPTSVSLPATWFKLKIGDRFLLRPGSHRVAAELPGYYPLDTRVEVGPLSEQTIPLTMTKLPGLVTLTTEPEVGAQVQVDGVLLGTTPLVDVELTPGVRRVELKAERHLDAAHEIDVSGGGERQSFALALTPDWGVVSLRTEPPGATVLVDGAEAGVTPAALEVMSGEHELEVRLAGYNAWSTRLLVEPNQPQELPDVTLAKADGRVEVASNPSEATVSVNGEFRGRTPLSLRLSPERAHRLTLSKPGYETLTRELSVAADSGRRLQLDLAPQLGEIQVASTPANAEVWVDGERRGATPVTLELTSVSHEIEIRQAGFAVERALLTPRPGFPQKLERTLTQLDETSGGGFAKTLQTSLSQELKLIPAGEFVMGSSRRDAYRRSNEPLRAVRVTHAFYLGAREVTNAEFRAFRPDHDSGTFEGHSLNGDDQPVVNVSWGDVAQYLNWLSVKDGLQPVYEESSGVWAPVRPLRNGYRLPTDAEWEWAARFAGQTAGLQFPWGEEPRPPDRSGNYADVTAAQLLPTALQTYDDGYAVTAPAGSYPANAYGIHDLGGNVAEWVQDFYTLDVFETAERVDDPLGPESGQVHVVRGASWRSATATDLRVAARASGMDGRDDVGFRIARNLR